MTTQSSASVLINGFADLDQVDGPRESGLVRVRWVTTGDEHAPRGIEPALDVGVHVLAADDSSPP